MTLRVRLSRKTNPLNYRNKMTDNNPTGFININKPKGITSHDVVMQVRRILNTKKVGHTGTLDPEAEGVLLLCLGKATRLSNFVSEFNKTYIATLKLGSSTDTQDATGKTVHQAPVPNITQEAIQSALNLFSGDIEQTPSIFSAIKKNGTPLYVLARQGKEISAPSRKIYIHYTKLIDVSLPLIKFEVSCSSGTYVRTICNDIGEKLQTFGHMQSLTRTKVGTFSVEQSHTLEQLKEAKKNNTISSYIIPMEEIISYMPKICLNNESTAKALNGVPIALSEENIHQSTLNKPGKTLVRLFSKKNVFFGIGEVSPSSEISAKSYRASGNQWGIKINKILVDIDKLLEDIPV